MSPVVERKNPKISLIVGDLSESGAGRWGGAVRPFLLCQALKKLNYEVEILGFVPEGASALNEADIPIYTILGSNFPHFFSSAKQLLEQATGDILYAIKPKVTSFGVSLLNKLQTQRPVILDIDDWELSLHGGEKWQYQPSLKQLARDVLKPNGALRFPDHPLYLQWMERLATYADDITLHTKFLQKRFGGTYVPNGKDTSLFNPENYDPVISRDRYHLSDYRVLMFPGAPRPYKGIEDVLIALDQLNEPDLRLVIVGGSPYDNYDEQLIERWGRWIIKLPKTSYKLMPEVVAAAHIVVVPQRDAPAAQAQFPLKLTDGMAMAKPILATRVGDIPEILGGTGYLVDPGCPEQIAEQVQWIFQNWEIASSQGLEARKRCHEYYSIDSMSKALSDLLTSY